MKNKDYILILQKILQSIDEGVHVVDPEGNSIIYNAAMADLEKTASKDVLKKPFHEVFKNLDEGDSTLMQALLNRKVTINQPQTYLNRDGKEITTVNSTLPVVSEDKVIGAIEIAKNITDIQKMSHAILELRKEMGSPQKTKEHKLKKYSFENLIGQNLAFRKMISVAQKATKSASTVLIYGETGTGKELFAQSMHYGSPRQEKPFLAQNCAALPANLLEGILFGTSKGGFTGALDRAGMFEQADGGTLLLDEINSMPYELQGKLLRVLQEDYIRRVGGSKDIPIDVRIIATINEEAETLIENKVLRKDLYYRLSIIPIRIPPLRERKDDISLLVDWFLDKHNKTYNKQVWMLSEKAKEKLMAYDYPGNVRELENLIMGALAMVDDDEHVLTDDCIFITPSHHDYRKNTYDFEDVGIDAYLESIEKEIIEKTLPLYAYNVTKTADHLKIKRQTLQHKMKKYKIHS